MSSLSGSNPENAIKGIKMWSACRTNPDNFTFDMTVNATAGMINTDITLEPQLGVDCRDRAQQGRTLIYPCIESDIDQIMSAFHEFGHILGFGDAYTGSDIKEGGTQPLPGFSQDIMATLGGRVLPYHLQILSQRY